MNTVSATTASHRAPSEGAELGVKLHVVSALEDMLALRAQWNDLLMSQSSRNLFLTPAWNCAWWRAFGDGKALHLLTVRGQGRLVGLLVLNRYKTRLRGVPVRVLGNFTNAHFSRTDLLVAPGYESVVAKEVARHLGAASSEWDMALLQQLPANAPWLPAFLAAASTHGVDVLEPQPGVGKCRMPLHQSWDDYTAQRSGHFRRTLGKTVRRIERSGTVTYRHLVGQEAPASDFAVFADVERRSWKDNTEGEAHLGPSGWAFQQEFSSATSDGITCDNWIVELNGEPVTIVHTVGYDRVSYCFQTLFDERVRDIYLGRVAVTKHFESVFDSGRYDALDFNGNSAFCKSWCDTELPFVSLQMFNHRPRSQLLKAMRRLVKMAGSGLASGSAT
jgi:Acetyltransferase (GNAT) domain